jgi:hypothetical protein
MSSKQDKPKGKFDINVIALQRYLKDKGNLYGFISWKKLSVRQNHKSEKEFLNATIKGIAVMEDFNDHQIRKEVPVHFTYSQNTHMGFTFKDEG